MRQGDSRRADQAPGTRRDERAAGQDAVPVVDVDWNTPSNVGDRTDRSLLSAAPVGKRVGALIDGLLAPRLAEYEGPVVRPVKLTATYG
jgi:hypothetical protein